MIDYFTTNKESMGPLEVSQSNALDFVTLNYITYLTLKSLKSLEILEKGKEVAKGEELDSIVDGIEKIENSIVEAATKIDAFLGWCA